MPKVVGKPLTNFLQGVRGYLQPSGQIRNRVSEVICNPLTYSPEGIGNCYKQLLFARGLPSPSNPWPKGIDFPLEQLSEGIR